MSKIESIKYLRSSETEEIFHNISASSDRYRTRNMAIFKLAKYCALRASEIGLLEVTDYDPNAKTIYCHRLKGGKNNTLRIVDESVVDALESYMIFRKIYHINSKYLFPSQKGGQISRKQLDSMMKRYCEGTAIDDDKRHFHVLRHTRAIELAEAGLDVKDIQFWLGHKKIENTMVYLQFTTKQHERMYKILLVS